MSEFQITDSEIFLMKGSDVFYHLATIQSNLREYICMVDITTQQCYIEEITGGHLSFIENDDLAFSLTRFCEQRGVTDMRTVHTRLRAVLHPNDP